MADRFRGSKAIQSHDLFPLLKKLAENCDRIPRHDNPEIIYSEIEETLRFEMEQYDARAMPSNGMGKHGDELTKVLLEEISAVLDNCRQLLELHRQCRKCQEEHTIRVQREFTSKALAMLQCLNSQFQEQLGHADPENGSAMDRQGQASKSSSSCCGSQENRPTKVKHSEQACSSRSSSSSDAPAAKRPCFLAGRARDPDGGGNSVKAESPNDADADDAAPSLGSDTNKADGKAAFRHPTAVTYYLKDWYEKHIEYPYPTVQQKDYLLERLLTMFNFEMMKTQLDNWFINQRRRVPNGPNLQQKLPGLSGGSAASSLDHSTSMPSTAHSHPPGVTPTSVRSPTLLSSVAHHSPTPTPVQFFHSPSGATFVQPANAATSPPPQPILLNTSPMTCAMPLAQFFLMTTTTAVRPATVQLSPQPRQPQKQLPINPTTVPFTAVASSNPHVASPVSYSTPHYSAAVIAPLCQQQQQQLHSPTLRSPTLYATLSPKPPGLRSPTAPAAPAPPRHPPARLHLQSPSWPQSVVMTPGNCGRQHCRQSKTTSPSHNDSSSN